MDERTEKIWKEIQAEVITHKPKLPEEKSVEDFIQEVGDLSSYAARAYLNKQVLEGKLKMRKRWDGRAFINLYSPK